MRINVLPEEIKNQIISGEIIEGPAECVKELMENSLDAKATKVDVEIVKGGKRFIGVRDNGIGIPSEDIKKAILSGATSKIRSLEDLQSINTYGYRGEALHAISLVSRFTLRSRFYQEGVGREIRVEGGKVVAEREVGMPVGTHAEVYDIFYNLPLRRVFLKKEDVERKRIYSIFKALALANPSVAFRLEAEGKEVFNFKAVDHIKDRVEDIFEERFEHLMGEEGPFKVDLFLSDRARGLFLFINNRPVNNKSLKEYIKRSTGRWRACVCYIQTPPYLLDVNIHPKKTFARAYALLEQHNGVPQKYDTHHLAVAIWKKEGDKIVYLSNYKVEAEVRSPILRAQRRELHKYPHQYGDNFGGWFQMGETGLYSINLYIKDEKGRTWKVNFDYMLQ